MRLKPTLYTTHRWLALVVSLQLLAWSLGGLTFSLLDIQNVRGVLDRAEVEPVRVEVSAVLPLADLAVPGEVETITLGLRRSRQVYELRTRDGVTLLEGCDLLGKPRGSRFGVNFPQENET